MRKVLEKQSYPVTYKKLKTFLFFSILLIINSNLTCNYGKSKQNLYKNDKKEEDGEWKVSRGQYNSPKS